VVRLRRERRLLIVLLDLARDDYLATAGAAMEPAARGV